MISKNKFVEIIKFIQDRDQLQNQFCSTLEAMSEGCYVDAWIYNSYETLIIDLLKISMNIPVDNDMIEYFIYDLNFGKDYSFGCIEDDCGKNIDLSTSEKLYEYLLSNSSEEKKTDV